MTPRPYLQRHSFKLLLSFRMPRQDPYSHLPFAPPFSPNCQHQPIQTPLLLGSPDQNTKYALTPRPQLQPHSFRFLFCLIPMQDPYSHPPFAPPLPPNFQHQPTQTTHGRLGTLSKNLNSSRPRAPLCNIIPSDCCWPVDYLLKIHIRTLHCSLKF